MLWENPVDWAISRFSIEITDRSCIRKFFLFQNSLSLSSDNVNIVGHTIMKEGVRPYILHILPGRSVYLSSSGGKQSSRLQLLLRDSSRPVVTRFSEFWHAHNYEFSLIQTQTGALFTDSFRLFRVFVEGKNLFCICSSWWSIKLKMLRIFCQFFLWRVFMEEV